MSLILVYFDRVLNKRLMPYDCSLIMGAVGNTVSVFPESV